MNIVDPKTIALRDRIRREKYLSYAGLILIIIFINQTEGVGGAHIGVAR